MPGAAVDVGTGATLVFATSAWVANKVMFDWDGMERRAHETSHLSTPAPGANQIANRTFMPGDLVDGGQITVNGHFNPNTNPPMHQTPETITATFPLVAGDSTAAIWACTGFFTGFRFGVPMDDLMTFTAVIKISGNISFTDAT